MGIIEDVRAMVLLLELDGVRAAKDLEGKYCEEENGRFVIKAIPKSTKYRLLKRLLEMGYLEQLEGVDRRHRYYKLSQLGKNYKQRVLNNILNKLERIAKEYSASNPLLSLSFPHDQLLIPWSSFQQLSCKYGIPPKLLFKLLKGELKQIMNVKVVAIKRAQT